MPTRAALTYPRLTIRRFGKWGAWPSAVVVRIIDAPGHRERCLTIHPDHRRAHAAAETLITRFKAAEGAP